MEKLRVAFIIAHPDDEHIPFGLPRELAIDGHDVSLIALTKGDLGSHTFFSRRRVARVRKREFQESAKILGAKATVLGLPDGNLHHQTQKAEQRLLKKLRLLSPDVVIIPNQKDYHQDHRVAHDIGQWAIFHMPDAPLTTRRFFRKIPPTTKQVSVYEMDTQGSQTWQSTHEDTGQNSDYLHSVNTILPISTDAMEKSVEAFHAHQSQLAPREGLSFVTLAIRGAKRRGQQAGFPYGVGLNFLNFGGYAFSTENALDKKQPHI